MATIREGRSFATIVVEERRSFVRDYEGRSESHLSSCGMILIHRRMITRVVGSWFTIRDGRSGIGTKKDPVASRVVIQFSLAILANRTG